MLSEDILNCMDRSVLCWLATVGTDGYPNVSPKEVFAAHGSSTVLIANIASPLSARNLKASSLACVSFIDVFVQKGYKLRGHCAVVERGDPGYDDLERPLLSITGGRFPIRSIFAFKVIEVAGVIAPSYLLFPETTEESQVDAAMNTYGVTSKRDRPL